MPPKQLRGVTGIGNDMSIGSTLAVEEAEDEFREKLAHMIAEKASTIVAAGDDDRAGALQTAAEWVRDGQAAMDDPTGVSEVELSEPMASKNASSAQIFAIKNELLPAAREAASNI